MMKIHTYHQYFIIPHKPDYNQYSSHQRHKKKNKFIKFTEEAKAFVREKLLQNWNSDQLSGYAKRHNFFIISGEWIYQFILKDKNKCGKLYLYLLHQNKKYRKRYGNPKRQGAIKNRRFIDDRPAIVNDKTRIGDWEIDTIIGKQQKQAVVHIVERVSKKLFLRRSKQKLQQRSQKQSSQD